MHSIPPTPERLCNLIPIHSSYSTSGHRDVAVALEIQDLLDGPLKRTGKDLRLQTLNEVQVGFGCSHQERQAIFRHSAREALKTSFE